MEKIARAAGDALARAPGTLPVAAALTAYGGRKRRTAGVALMRDEQALGARLEPGIRNA